MNALINDWKRSEAGFHSSTTSLQVNFYTAKIEEIWIKKLGSNLRHADDTALCAESQEQAERPIGKVSNIVKARLLKLNVKQTKPLKIGRYSPMQEL